MNRGSITIGTQGFKKLRLWLMPQKDSNWKHKCCTKIEDISDIISPHCESCFNKNRETFLAGGPRSTVRDRAETLFYHGPRSHSLTRCRQFYGRQFALFSSSKVNFHDVTLGHPNKKLSHYVFWKDHCVSKYFVTCIILEFFDTYLSKTMQFHYWVSMSK